MGIFKSSRVKKEIRPIKELVNGALKEAEKKLQGVEEGYKKVHYSTDYSAPRSEEKSISEADSKRLLNLHAQARKDLANKLHEIASMIEDHRI